MIPQKSDALWRALAVVTVMCLATITAILVRREFFPATVAIELPEPGPERPRGPEPPVRVDDWNSVISRGHRIGPANAPITLVEFSDFECPSCRRFALETLPALRSTFPDQIALIYRHYPLRNHLLALPAARAAECAALQGRFAEFHDLAFREIDSLKASAFQWLAKTSGVPNATAFTRCTASKETAAAIEQDLAEVRRIGGTGTPTLVLNGMLLRPPYNPANLSIHIRNALARENR